MQARTVHQRVDEIHELLSKAHQLASELRDSDEATATQQGALGMIRARAGEAMHGCDWLRHNT
jgi:hypothetical protein